MVRIRTGRFGGRCAYAPESTQLRSPVGGVRSAAAPHFRSGGTIIVPAQLMIVRQVAECVSCESRIVTRTQIGHKDRQEHSFPCPTCGVSISFAFDLNQEKGQWKSRDPKNAKWVDSDHDAVK